MFRGGFSGGKTRKEFVEEIADVYISKVQYYTRPLTLAYTLCLSVREYVFFFFSDFKKHDFLRFFEMTYQKVVKSHQQKFSPQYITKE